jgi:hypothetical protein
MGKMGYCILHLALALPLPYRKKVNTYLMGSFEWFDEIHIHNALVPNVSLSIGIPLTVAIGTIQLIYLQLL